MAPEKQWYETHADVTAVEFATVDGKLVRLEQGKPYGTTDPRIIAELEQHPSVKSVPAPGSKPKADQEDGA